jgi:hypothetical protein
MTIQHTHSSIEDYLDQFAGREGMPGYDETKTIRIAEENRDYVWSPTDEKEYIVHVLLGYPISQMVICDNRVLDGGNRSTVFWLWRRNMFTVRIGDWEGTYSAMTPDLVARWNRAQIPTTVITNATPEQRANIFEAHNKGKQLSFGEKVWNRKYCPLAHEACAMVYSRDFPLRDLISAVWRKPNPKPGKRKSELGRAYQLIAGSMFGPQYCSSKFSGPAVPLLMNTTREQIDHSNLRTICEAFRTADPDGTIGAKQKAWVFKYFAPAAIHDFHTSRDTFDATWARAIPRLYAAPRDVLKQIRDVKTARANNLTRLAALSQNVYDYVAGLGVDGDAQTEYEYDTEEDEEDEEED